MCDYSLHAVNTRDAEIGDKLEVYQFNFATKGMRDRSQDKSPLYEHACAVCMKEGTELSLTAPVVEEYGWPSWAPFFSRKRKHAHATATFRKIMPKEEYKAAYTHTDGIEFPDGTQVLINNLEAGQVMTVLQVPAEKTSRTWEAMQERELERTLGY